MKFTTYMLTALTVGGFLAMGVHPSASAADQSAYKLISTSDGLVRASVKAFNAGKFEKSINFSKKALRANPSKRRMAITYSNLCAAYGAIGEMEKANQACKSALEMRPNYEPALVNYNIVNLHLAQHQVEAKDGK